MENEDITSLKQQVEDLRTLNKAWERLYELLIEEKKEANEIISAHEHLSLLVKMEKKETKNVIEALLEHQKISQSEIQQKTITLKNILNINRDIISVPNGETLLSKIVESILHVLSAGRGFLYLKKDGVMKLSNPVNISEAEISDQEFMMSLSVIKDAVNEKKTQIRTFRDYRYSPDREFMIVITSPLLIQGQLSGVFYFDSATLSRPLDSIDIDTVEIFSSQIALAIENSVLYEQLEEAFKNKTKELNIANRKMDSIIKDIRSDMRLAKKIQTKLLPDQNIQFPGINLSIEYMPMLEIGGDIYDIFEIRDGYIRLFLADATGHGIQAALTTTLIKSEFDKIRRSDTSPGKILKSLNNNFMNFYKSLNVFFSCIICDINLNLKEIIFSSAGHPDQVLIDHEKKITLLPKHGRMIGLKEDSEYRDEKCKFKSGSKLILYTDGLFEEFDTSMEMFGEERLLKLIGLNKSKPISVIQKKCITELRKFLEYENNFHDDITFIGIECL